MPKRKIVAFREGLADPTHLDGLREALVVSELQGRLAPLRMRRIEIVPEVLGLLAGRYRSSWEVAESPAPGAS